MAFLLPSLFKVFYLINIGKRPKIISFGFILRESLYNHDQDILEHV